MIDARSSHENELTAIKNNLFDMISILALFKQMFFYVCVCVRFLLAAGPLVHSG